MGGRGGGSRTVSSSPGAARDDNRILGLTQQMMPISQEWVSLARLRDNLEGMSRERQDQAIGRLLQEGRISLIPEPDPHGVRARERAAAFRHAGRNFHLIRVRRNS
jgi:hypothetical protein